MRYVLAIATWLILILGTAAQAQFVPNHASPVGRGPGVSGFNSVGPCPSYQAVITRGTSADPACKAAVLNVLSYGGVVGDNSNDDRNGIQAAINDAENLATTTGAVACVYFPRPVSFYKITSTLIISNAICIVGDGGQVSFITNTGDFPIFTVASTGALDSLTFKSFGCVTSYGGAKVDESCIKFTGAHLNTSILISDVVVQGLNRGFWFSDHGALYQRGTITGIKCTNSGGAGVARCIDGYGMGEWVISNSHMGATTYNILMDASSDTTIIGNQFVTATSCIGISNNTAHFEINGNECDGGSGIFLELTNADQIFAYANLIGGAYAPALITTPTGTSINIQRNQTITASITGAQNNYNPTSFQRARTVLLSSNGSYNITGLVPTGDNQEVCFYNASSFIIGFPFESGSSTAANRFAGQTGAFGLNINQGETVCFRYNMSTSRWNLQALPYNQQLVNGIGVLEFRQLVDFNSANTDTAITITLPAGINRYAVNTVHISGASHDLSTATFGVFTGTVGTGVAIVPLASAVTVTATAENTNNNAQQFTPSTTISVTATTLYIRINTAEGAAATAMVTISIRPLS